MIEQGISVMQTDMQTCNVLYLYREKAQTEQYEDAPSTRKDEFQLSKFGFKMLKDWDYYTGTNLDLFQSYSTQLFLFFK